jgi:hypothetical protein
MGQRSQFIQIEDVAWIKLNKSAYYMQKQQSGNLLIARSHRLRESRDERPPWGNLNDIAISRVEKNWLP